MSTKIFNTLFALLFLASSHLFGQLVVKNSNQTIVMTVTDEGKMGVGVTNPQYKVDIAGRLHATGNSVFDNNLTIGHLAGHGNVNVYADANGTLQPGGPFFKVVSGKYGGRLTPDSGSDETVSFNFGYTFNSPPTVTATLRRENNLCDAYIYVFNVSTTGATVWFSGAQNHPDCGSFNGFHWIAAGN